MKKIIYLLVFIMPLLFVNCSDDDDNGTNEISTTYDLVALGDSGVAGTAKFVKVNDTDTQIIVTLTGTPMDGDHPMHIHTGSVSNPGGVTIALTNVNGATGVSNTTVTKSDDGFTYEELLAYEGYINVHLSAEDLATVVAQGNIGSNVN